MRTTARRDGRAAGRASEAERGGDEDAATKRSRRSEKETEGAVHTVCVRVAGGTVEERARGLAVRVHRRDRDGRRESVRRRRNVEKKRGGIVRVCGREHRLKRTGWAAEGEGEGEGTASSRGTPTGRSIGSEGGFDGSGMESRERERTVPKDESLEGD